MKRYRVTGTIAMYDDKRGEWKENLQQVVQVDEVIRTNLGKHSADVTAFEGTLNQHGFRYGHWKAAPGIVEINEGPTEAATPQAIMLPNNKPVEVLCPKCDNGTKLIIKTNRHNNTQFLGCPKWPNCDHTQDLPEDLKMQLSGAPKLPGFD